MEAALDLFYKVLPEQKDHFLNLAEKLSPQLDKHFSQNEKEKWISNYFKCDNAERIKKHKKLASEQYNHLLNRSLETLVCVGMSVVAYQIPNIELIPEAFSMVCYVSSGLSSLLGSAYGADAVDTYIKCNANANHDGTLDL